MKKFKSVFILFLLFNLGFTTNKTANSYKQQNSYLNEEIVYSIKKISAGTRFSSIVLDYGDHESLYTWGQNDIGQLGLGDEGNDTDRNRPTEVKLPIEGEIKFSGCSRKEGYHSFLVLNDGESDHLYTWGSNIKGQLGLGDENNRNTPTEVTSLPEGEIKEVSLGGDHSSAVVNYDSKDHLYTWGRNDFGQLGLGDKNKRNTPTEVTSLPEGEIKEISFGDRHSSVVLNNDSKDHLYTWGLNKDGQLGLGNESDKNTPTKVTSLPEGEIKQVSFGVSHSSVIVKSKSIDYLYIWGRNSNGELGLGDQIDRNKPEKVKLPINGQINDISIGWNYSSAVVNDGDKDHFYTWGHNYYGELGLGYLYDGFDFINTPIEVNYYLQNPNPYVEGSFEVTEITHNSFNFSFNICKNDEYVSVSEEDIKTKTYLKLDDKEFDVDYKYKESINSEIDKYNFSLTSDSIEGKTYNDIKLHIGGTIQLLETPIIDTIITIPSNKNPNPYVEGSFEVSGITYNSFNFSFNIYNNDEYINLPEEDIKTKTYLKLNDKKFDVTFKSKNNIDSQDKYNFSLTSDSIEGKTYNDIKLHIGGTENNLENSINNVTITIPYSKNPNPYLEDSFEVLGVTKNSFTFSFSIYKNDDYINLSEEEIENNTFLYLNNKIFNAKFLETYYETESKNSDEVKYKFIVEGLKSSTLYNDIKLHIGGTPEGINSVIQIEIKTEFNKSFWFTLTISLVSLFLLIIILIIIAIIIKKKRDPRAANKKVYTSL